MGSKPWRLSRRRSSAARWDEPGERRDQAKELFGIPRVVGGENCLNHLFVLSLGKPAV